MGNVLTILLFALPAGLVAYLVMSLYRLNRAAAALKQGDLTVSLPYTHLPFLKKTTDHFETLSKAYRDLHKMEEYQQKMLAFEKREMAYLLEKEDLARQLEIQLEETRRANLRVSDLNRDLEEKNLSLNEAINRLSSLNQISRMLGLEHDRKRIYQMVVSLPLELIQAEIGHLVLMDEEEHRLYLEYSMGLGEESDKRRSVPIGKGIAGWVAKNKKPLLVKDFASHEEFTTRSSIGYERRNAISSPIMIKDELIGVITLINKKGASTFTDDEKTLLATIASEAAMALHNALLVEKIQKSYFAMVQSLIIAVESKDVYTRGHSDRVTQYSMLIGEQLGLSNNDMESLQQAAVLHDIGKITVELSILNKPSSLSQDEFSKIRLHPLVGYRILEPIDFEEKVKKCVLQHHEKLDGSGYPNGLAGDDILYEARILSVADAFDAMTTKRPYREPLTIEGALREMEKCAGSQFDGEVVNVFRKVITNMTSTGALNMVIN
jgi:putative nucleotidyltransferase with HDIG domain